LAGSDLRCTRQYQRQAAVEIAFPQNGFGKKVESAKKKWPGMTSSFPSGSDGTNFQEKKMAENDRKEEASRLECDERRENRRWKTIPRRQST
jgi:hypothetical protein